MQGLAWAIVLLAVGLGVMVLEVFIPSGGVLGFVSVLALVSAVVTAFLEQGVLGGFFFLALTIVLVPMVLAVAFRWFPVTPLGRRVLPPPPEATDVVPQREAREEVRRLVGSSGLVVDELVPWGTVRVAGRTLEAMSEGGVVGAGEPVDVVGTQGLSLVVRRRDHEPQEPPPASAPRGAPTEDRSTPGKADAALNEALEAFDFGDLGRPGA